MLLNLCSYATAVKVPAAVADWDPQSLKRTGIESVSDHDDRLPDAPVPDRTADAIVSDDPALVPVTDDDDAFDPNLRPNATKPRPDHSETGFRAH